MLPVMDHLNEISVEELQEALDNVDGNKPTQRLLAAIAYKNGVTQTELAEWYDTERKTIYNWLNRLDTDEPLEQAVTDAHRSGRKRGSTPSTYGPKAATRSVASPTTIRCSSLFVRRTSTVGRRFSSRSTSPPQSSDSPETSWTDRCRSSSSHARHSTSSTSRGTR